MKNKLFFAILATAALSLPQQHAIATVHTIMVGAGSGFSFSPSSGVTAVIGDTISFVWVEGTHTTTSTSVPSGAAAWSNDINSGSTTFMYVPTVAGTYNYQCNFHHAMGMIGSFVVTAPTGISTVAGKDPVTISPNPASSLVKVHTNNNDAAFSLYDVAGKLVSVLEPVNRTATDVYLNVSKVAAGMYMLKIESGNTASMVKLEIAK